MSPDPYTNGLLDTRYPCAEKSAVSGELVCVLDARAPQRGLELSPVPVAGGAAARDSRVDFDRRV